jgi:putative oxidoreductase
MPHASSASSVNPSEQPMRPHLAASVDHASTTPRAVAPVGSVDGLRDRLDRLDAAAHRWLVAHSITLLRMSLGAVFLGFGILKLFPGVSPAEDLVKTTTHILTFGLVPGSWALAGVGVLECLIGVCLLSGRALRPAVYLLGMQLVGILSPIVLLTSRMFDGPHHAPTLEGQYVLKDLILVAATLVLAATLRGGRLESTPRDGESHLSEAARR